MIQDSVMFAQNILRYPLSVFEQIINSLGMISIYITAAVGAILIVKIIQRTTKK